MLKNGKCTQEEMEVRIQKVIQLYCRGQGRHQIVRYLRTKLKIDISIETVDRYISKAKKQITKKANINVNHEVGKSLARLEDLSNKCYMMGDFKTCLAIEKEASNLLGLITNKIDVTSNKEAIRSITLNVLNADIPKGKGKDGGVT